MVKKEVNFQNCLFKIVTIVCGEGKLIPGYRLGRARGRVIIFDDLTRFNRRDAIATHPMQHTLLGEFRMGFSNGTSTICLIHLWPSLFRNYNLLIGVVRHNLVSWRWESISKCSVTGLRWWWRNVHACIQCRGENEGESLGRCAKMKRRFKRPTFLKFSNFLFRYFWKYHKNRNVSSISTKLQLQLTNHIHTIFTIPISNHNN